MGVARLDLMITAQTGQAQAQMKALELRMEKTMTKANILTGSLTTAFTAIGTMAKLSVAAFAGLSAASVATTALVKDFNKNMQHSAAIAGFNKEQLDKLTRSVNSLSIEFGQSADNMSAGMVELTKSGLSMAEIESVMDDITKAMLANSISFETAAQIGIFSVKQFGDSFADLPEMFDKIQVAAQSTIMDFEDLQQALQYAGSMAVLSKVGFEELLAVFGTLSQRAMKMGVASRSVNQMMMSLIDHTDEMQEWIDKMGLGVEVIKDGALNLDGLIRAFSEMDMTMEQLKKSSDIFTTRALRSWGLLITGAEEYMELVDEKIPGAQGALTNVFEKQRETLSFQLSQMGQIMITPYRSPEYMDMLLDTIKALREPVARISSALATGLWNFLKYVNENASNLGQFFENLANFALDIVGPFYSLGKILFNIKDFFGLMENGLVKLVFLSKMYNAMGVNHLQLTMASLRLQITKNTLLKQRTIMSNLLVKMDSHILKLEELKTSLMAKGKSIKSTEIALVKAEIKMAGLKNKQEMLTNQLTAARLQMTMQILQATMATVVASGMMGAAMGWDTGSFIMSTLMGGMTGAKIGMAFGGKGMVAGGIIGALVGGGAYAAGTALHEEPETPDFANVDEILNNVEYSEPAQASGASESYSFAKGGMIPQNGWYYMHQGEEVNNQPNKGGNTYVFEFNGPVGSKREMKRWVKEAMNEMGRR